MERLRHIREQGGYSQQNLADESGVSQHTISEIELGRRKPQGRTLRKLATVLGVEVADFYGESTYPKESAPPAPQRSFNNLLEEEGRETLVRSCVEYALGRAERWNAWLAEEDRELLGEMVVEYDDLARFLIEGVFQTTLGTGEAGVDLGTEVWRALHRLNGTIERALESIERIDAQSAQRARALLGRWTA